MAVKIRLSRKGRAKAPFYHIVIADARAPRDGKFIEKIGTYNPMTKPATIEIDRNAAYDWLTKGAQPTDTVKAILRFKGVYYKKHLMRGVKKGAMTVEQADTLWQQWIDAKEGKISSRRAQTAADLEAFRKLVSGEAKKVKAPVADESAHEAAEAFKVTEESVEAPAVEEVAPVAEEVTETAPAVEEVTPVVEEAVATEEAAPAVEEEVVAAVEEAAPAVATEEASEETKTEEEA
ncbi:MAG TPA: 30S ribosomal protein S16 [Saprospiraceae bacterium]|nr:30S ribosomal protein S16 [Saprospiraceae bacterium]